MRYPVNEAFLSIQGEAYWTGRPAVFVRLAGCNLNCTWCDTDHTKTWEHNEAELLELCYDLWPSKPAEELGEPMVVITGGEPTIHDLEPLCKALYDNKWFVAVETNGTQLGKLPTNYLNWITVSPKSNEPPNGFYWGNELKVVLAPGVDPEAMAKGGDFHWKWIQPCSEDFAPAVEYVKENPTWRLSLQTQKCLGIT